MQNPYNQNQTHRQKNDPNMPKLPSIGINPQAQMTLNSKDYPRKITIMGYDDTESIIIDFDKKDIQIRGDWTAAANLFLARVKKLLSEK